MIDRLIEWDKELFLALNGDNGALWDMIMWWISAKITWMPLYAVILFFIIRRFRWKAVPVLIALTVVIVITDQFSVHVFKNMFERLRPSHNPEFEGLIHIVNGYRGGDYGFISSHAANSFGFAVFSSCIFRLRWYTLGILCWASVVSCSRIYIGVHYPADVFCGALFGSAVAIIIYLIYKRIIRNKMFS